jgi:hypothetical protein
MPVLPLVGSTMMVSGFRMPFCLRVLDHGHADTILHGAERIEELTLQRDGGVEASGDLVELHKRRAADGFDDVVIDHGSSRCAVLSSEKDD